MTDQLSLLPMLDDAEHPTWLLNGKEWFRQRDQKRREAKRLAKLAKDVA